MDSFSNSSEIVLEIDAESESKRCVMKMSPGFYLTYKWESNEWLASTETPTVFPGLLRHLSYWTPNT